MAKINWLFQNEQGTNLNRYKAINVSTGEEITFDLFRNGNISVVGTPLNAENMNSLINAINEVYDNFIDDGNIKVKNEECYSEITPYEVSNNYADRTVRFCAEEDVIEIIDKNDGDYMHLRKDGIDYKKDGFNYGFKFPITQGETLLVGRDLIDIKPNTILLNKINDNVIQQYDSYYKEKFNVYKFDNDRSEGSGYMDFGDAKVCTTIKSNVRPTWNNGSGNKQFAMLDDISLPKNPTFTNLSVESAIYSTSDNFLIGEGDYDEQLGLTPVYVGDFESTFVKLRSFKRPVWATEDEEVELATLDDIGSSSGWTLLTSGYLNNGSNSLQLDGFFKQYKVGKIIFRMNRMTDKSNNTDASLIFEGTSEINGLNNDFDFPTYNNSIQVEWFYYENEGYISVLVFNGLGDKAEVYHQWYDDGCYVSFVDDYETTTKCYYSVWGSN